MTLREQYCGVGMKPIGRLQVVLAATSLSCVLMGKQHVGAVRAKLQVTPKNFTQTGRESGSSAGASGREDRKVVAHESG